MPALRAWSAALVVLATAGAARGETVLGIDVPASPGSMAPQLEGRGGNILLSWIEPSSSGGEFRAVRFARLEPATGERGGYRWSAPRTVVESDRLFANWADVPSLHRAGDRFLIAHWLARSADAPYAYDVAIARSGDGGETWAMMGVLHEDGTPTEHGFVSAVAEGAGLRVFWLDGRETVADKPMTLRTALVREDGITARAVIDSSVCDCCQTSAARTSRGPVVVYRDRTESEIRDISIARTAPAGGWTPPSAVHADGWNVPGCPVNGPAVDAREERLAVAWFTASGNTPRVLAAFSDDAGRSFGPPVVVDGEAPPGRAAVMIAPDGGALVVWLAAGTGDEAEIRCRHVGRDGSLGDSVPVAATTGARASGFPRIAPIDDRLAVMVWTRPEGGTTSLRSALLALDAIPRAGRESTPRAEREPVFVGRPGDRMPRFEAPSLEGKMIALESLIGEVVLVNVWATWCAPCREEMPRLAALQARHEASGLRVVGINVDDAASMAEVRDFVRQAGIRYPILADPANRSSRVFALSALPGTLLFDRSGSLVAIRRGVLEPGDMEFEAAIEEALAGAGPDDGE